MAFRPIRYRGSTTAIPLLLAALAAGCGVDDPAGPAAVRETLTASAPDAVCSGRAGVTVASLLDCVTIDGVRAHQAALQAIADANGGTRATGTPGFTASVDYVATTLEAAGYTVTLQPFEVDVRPPGTTLEQVSPGSASYATGAFTGSPGGSATAAVTPVDLDLGLGNASTSGCEAEDFAAFPWGTIALIQRGGSGCTFGLKASNAQAAGAVAVIIFNQGDSESREDLIVGTLGATVVGIPVVGASYADGVALSAPGVVASVSVPAAVSTTEYNVLAETPFGDPDNVVMVGGHLDSVEEGPGIQDNGSGSAAILETALQMAGARTTNKVRFAWWGAEEQGLVGSNAYVAGLSSEELDKIALYLNFDMIGSPNFGFFIYDGDDSDGVGFGPGPDGSAEIEDVFEAFYQGRGLPYEGSDFSGRSDYGAFIDVGIPAGGLFTGAEVLKTEDQVALWGGVAGEQFDQCYHLACDTFDNVNLFALETNADAVAYATLTFANSTEAVNGVRGRRTPPGRPGSLPPGPPPGVPPGPPAW